jgi:hypothetical protein
LSDFLLNAPQLETLTKFIDSKRTSEEALFDFLKEN